jgi:NADPH:quinone reductase-like Zn-dependent oxidoreductase
MMAQFQKKNHAVILPEYNSNLVRAIFGLKTSKREIRKLKDDEVLIKMEAAPCNPSDIAFIRGGYNIRKSLPAVPGFEGCGIVTETGNNSRQFQGRRVSSFTQTDSDGTWAEYFISKAEDCLLLKDDLDFEQAASLSINPFTAYGLIELAIKKKCKAIIQNAGSGQIAEFVRILAQMNGLEVINVVRKEEQVKYLTSQGATYVLNSAKENYKEELNKLTHQLKAGMAIDAVGGEQTGQLMNALPFHSDVVLYGGLAGGNISAIEPFDIIFRDKKLYGFNLNEWKVAKSKEEFESINNLIQDLLIQGKFRSRIQKIFKIDEVINGIRTYIKSMSAGKILFKP